MTHLSQLWKDPPFSMGKSTISMAIFNSFLYVYQRVPQKIELEIWPLEWVGAMHIDSRTYIPLLQWEKIICLLVKYQLLLLKYPFSVVESTWLRDRSKCDIVMTGLYQHFLWAKSPCSSLMLFDSFVILPNSHQKTGDINPRGGCLTRRRRRARGGPRLVAAGDGWKTQALMVKDRDG